jgi:uncharacterized membrane protein YgcG
MRMSRLLLLVGLLVLFPSALAAQRTLVLERFDSELRVRPDGRVEVIETLRPRFRGSWEGIFRDVSLEHRTADDRRERLDVELVSITDEAGGPLRFEARNQGRWTRRFQIWVPGAEDATRTVVIRYLVRNALRFFEAESDIGALDELYWNVTGNGWDIPIEESSAVVVLPDGVSPRQWAGYTGPAGSTETAVEVRVADGSVAFNATRAMAPGEGLTVAVGWEPGAVARPPALSRFGRGVAGLWPVLLPVLGFFVAFRQWRSKGKDPARRAISVQYDPPEDLSPAEVGTLVDHKAEMHDITATLVDLAVRGFLHIEKRKTRTLGIFSNDEYIFHLKKSRSEWDTLRTHEELYLDALFKHGGAGSAGGMLRNLLGGDRGDAGAEDGAGDGPTYGSVTLSSLKNRFYKDVEGIRKALYAELVDKGHYHRDPNAVKTGWTVVGISILVIGAGLGLWAAEMGFFLVEPLVLGGAVAACGLVILAFGQIMPARTPQGARAMEWALGFREFLAKVEEPRFSRMITSPEMFERYLAYAMAFKVEGKWAKAFESMYAEPPRWYTGYDGGAFRATAFTRDLTAMSTAASSTMSSSPSGSGGGGSSGGGSGGGGGGGF